MISPEILRRFPFFYGFDDAQLKALAMIAEEIEVEERTTIFEEGTNAQKFYLLIDGSIDIFVKSVEESDPASRRDFSVGEVNPGEIFGMNSLLEPYQFNFTTRSGPVCKIIEFDGAGLRALIQIDQGFACTIMRNIAKSLMERLYSTRVQLAAAWA